MNIQDVYFYIVIITSSLITILSYWNDVKGVKIHSLKNLNAGMFIMFFAVISLLANHGMYTTNKQDKIVSDSTNSKRYDSLLFEIKRDSFNDSIMFLKIDSGLRPHNLKLKDFNVIPIHDNYSQNNSINVISNYQKGGQTAGTINNVH